MTLRNKENLDRGNNLLLEGDVIGSNLKIEKESDKT